MHRKSLHESPQMLEIIKTEKTYNASLAKLLDKLSKMNAPIFDKFVEQTTNLHNISNGILENFVKTNEILEKTQDNQALSPEENIERMKVSLKRVELIEEFFKTLRNYSQLFVELSNMIAKNPDLYKQINAEFTAQDKNELNGLLIQPIQRGPRYILLINELIKFINDNPDKVTERQHNMIEALREKIQEELIKLNEQTSKLDKKEYQFGDYTYATLEKLSTFITGQEKGYKFGDISLWVYKNVKSYFGGDETKQEKSESDDKNQFKK